VGLMIGGNGLGGMAGRIATALVADAFGWRYALGGIGVLGLIATVIFWRILPPSRHFHPRPLRAGALLRTFGEHLRNPKLVPLFAQGFLLMGTFVTSYNYVTYHLLAPPYQLSHAAVGSIFVVYLVGIFASAWIGALAHRAGRARMLALMIGLMLAGIVLMTLPLVAAIVAGIAVLTFGFFGAHSVASTWVGLRAPHSKAQAAALYLFFYYVGSSLAGSMGGVFWDRWGWIGVISFVVAMISAALTAVAFLRPVTVPATAPG
jgi:YNFM family putative membrane transporter